MAQPLLPNSPTSPTSPTSPNPPAPPTARSRWRHWMWFGTLNRRWLLNRPLLWRSGLLWLPGPVLVMTALFTALAHVEPVSFLTLAAAPVPSTAGLLVVAVTATVFFCWVLVPRGRHPLGTRGGRDHLQVLVVTCLGMLLLVLPLCWYDGIYSQRVAQLAPQATVRDAIVRLQNLNQQACSPEFDTLHALQLAALQRDLDPILGAVQFVQLNHENCESKQREQGDNLQIITGSGTTLYTAGLRFRLERVLHEHSQGAGPVPHTLNAMATSFQSRQVGCVLFALLALLLELWRQFVSSRGRTVAMAGHVHRLTARLAFWRIGRSLLRPVLLHQPALWAARPWPYIVGCFLISVVSLALLILPGYGNRSSSVATLLFLLSPLFAGAGIWYWKRVSIARPLAAVSTAHWRWFAVAVALGVAVAMLVALVLPLHMLSETSPWREREAAAVIAALMLMAAQVVSSSLLAQVAPGRGGLVAMAGCYGVAIFAALSLPPFGAALLLPAFVLTGLASAWTARRTGSWYGRRWAVVAGQLHISLAPVASLSLVLALHASRQEGDTELLLSFSLHDNLFFLAILVLAMGWLITPAIVALQRSCAEPV